MSAIGGNLRPPPWMLPHPSSFQEGTVLGRSPPFAWALSGMANLSGMTYPALEGRHWMVGRGFAAPVVRPTGSVSRVEAEALVSYTLLRPGRPPYHRRLKEMTRKVVKE